MDDIPHVRTRTGQQWKLVHFGPPDVPAPPLPGRDLTLEFTATEVGGVLGCNTCEGPYETDGPALRFGAMNISLRRCLNAALIRQEGHYLHALYAVQTFARAGDTLSLFYPGGVLRYVAIDLPPGQVGWFVARDAELVYLRAQGWDGEEFSCGRFT